MNAVVTALDLTAVRDLVRPLDAVASVYLASRPAGPTVDPAEDLDLRWRAEAGRLAEQGADAETLTAVHSGLAGLVGHADEVAVFACDGEVRLAQPLPGAAVVDRARYAAPAEVVPLLGWLQRHPAYVAVLTDRLGADITSVAAGTTAEHRSVVVGPDDEVERNAPGGWSQPRYQRRAEDTWLHNAAAVARAVAAALRDTRAGLLLVGGDVRAVQLLRDHLPQAVRRSVVLRHLPGGRSPDGSYPARQAAVRQAVDAYVGAETTALLRRYADERSTTAVDGTAATLRALAAGRVHTLFVADAPDDDRTAWFGPGVLCADQPASQPAADDGPLVAGRLVDVAVRAALLTEADVRVVGPVAAAGFTGRIGGLCRYA